MVVSLLAAIASVAVGAVRRHSSRTSATSAASQFQQALRQMFDVRGLRDCGLNHVESPSSGVSYSEAAPETERCALQMFQQKTPFVFTRDEWDREVGTHVITTYVWRNTKQHGLALSGTFNIQCPEQFKPCTPEIFLSECRFEIEQKGANGQRLDCTTTLQ